MKRFLSSAALATAAILVVSASAQTSPSKEEQQLLELIKDVQAQQAQIADNQGKIDAKMADLGETIRVARLFAGKAGK
jgi:outer membrane lipoprotein-sorting protein